MAGEHWMTPALECEGDFWCSLRVGSLVRVHGEKFCHSSSRVGGVKIFSEPAQVRV